MPARSSASTYEERARSEPPTSAPQAFATSASALIPAPPIPTNQRRLPFSGSEPLTSTSPRRQRDELVGDVVCSTRPGAAAHRLAHRAQPFPVCEQLRDERRH